MSDLRSGRCWRGRRNQIRGDDLQVTLVGAPSGSASRHHQTTPPPPPGAEWGAEYAAVLRKHSSSHLSAVVLLPRHELMVRHLAFPASETASAQSASSRRAASYPEDEAAWLGAFVRLPVADCRRPARSTAMRRCSARRTDRPLHPLSAAVVYARSGSDRTNHGRFPGVSFERAGLGGVRESPARPAFSATFEDATDRWRFAVLSCA
jgi:hypothetical protein